MSQSRKLRIVKIGDFVLPSVEEQVASLNTLSYCDIIVHENCLEIPEPDYKIGNFISEYSFDSLSGVLRSFRGSEGVPETDILVGIINHSLQRNYFSISSADGMYAVASVSDVEEFLGGVTLVDFRVLEIAQHAVAAIEHHKWHKEPRRCLFDFCGDKRDIANSLAYRSFCNSCSETLTPDAVTYLEFAYTINERTIGETMAEKILFLSADPSDASRLKIQKEYREISHELQLAVGRDGFSFDTHLAVRPSDLSRALLKQPRPKYLHFSGHGTNGSGSLCLEDDAGNSEPVSVAALANLIGPISDDISCVLLNACYSENQAHALLAHVDFVVGMNDAIGDDAAIAYSIGFYQAIFNGESVPTAHKLGCAQIQMTNEGQHQIPTLLEAPNAA